MTFIAVVTDDGRRLVLDDPVAFRRDYAQWAGHEVEVEVRKRRSKRTLRQNAWMHAALKPWADHLGYQVPELKLALLGACFGYHTVCGEQVPVRPHTHDLTTQEFADLMDLALQKAAEDGVVILLPEEYHAARKRRVA